jgi:hypothetical protein
MTTDTASNPKAQAIAPNLQLLHRDLVAAAERGRHRPCTH